MTKKLSKGKVIRIQSREAILKRKVRWHLKRVGFTRDENGVLTLPAESKDAIRAAHQLQRAERSSKQGDFLKAKFPKLSKHFAIGTEVDPAAVKPRLERVLSHTWQADLFKLASLTWSVPVSPGFGRRLRYLVWDDGNERLMGIIAIGDPVFNLRSRDEYIGWTGEQRLSQLVHTMDAYVLGAVPPYNQLLGGKVVAALLRTREIYDDFQAAYGARKGVISKKVNAARLAAITTTSSMGRSSVYNRVKLDEMLYLKPIGYSSGYGHFHIPDQLFQDLREYLRTKEHRYADQHAFGKGPNWKMRVTRTALDMIGMRSNLVMHGIKREVFICEMASNTIKFLKGEEPELDISSLKSVEEVAALACKRWLVPRATRRPEYLQWTREELVNLVSKSSGVRVSLLEPKVRKQVKR
ncbi:Druantia anti-phage system protein DruA [Sulfuricella sp.]|uniref:Druantia anti-phage system protein DruA n=1 Tax=Sulfuricella sp. TaxID=2099377 RepID=UPI002CC3A3F0|nr:Druantia anti-phage system protein DruA [Sulfuricella sp.]HUX62785.1 Druantia anti-phage system protein DruA [Sulfuricella sp.]